MVIGFTACQDFFILFLFFEQGLLKKHEAFETDFTVHRDRVNDVCANGEELIKKVLTIQHIKHCKVIICVIYAL